MTRVAVVTGGVRGIGAAIASRLKADGFLVVANYRSNTVAAQRFESETGIATRQWDVADHDACAAQLTQIERAFGPVEILINNAGITRDGMFHKLSRADWDEVLRVNLGGCFNMARAVFPGMRERRWGRIVSISSINAQTGQAGQTNYSAAKAGVIGFTKALAQEGARVGVTVNAVAPGYTDTDMVAAVAPAVMETILAKIPVGRLGQADEVASAVSWLVSEQSAFVTGSTLSVNGGQSMV